MFSAVNASLPENVLLLIMYNVSKGVGAQNGYGGYPTKGIGQ